MRRIAMAALLAVFAVGCSTHTLLNKHPSEQMPAQPENVQGPAEKDASIAAQLAEDFMKSQPGADRFSKQATAVRQESTGVYVVKFQLLANASKNHALVRVSIKERRCERIPVK